MVHVEFVALALSAPFHGDGICTEPVAFTFENLLPKHGESVAETEGKSEAESIASNEEDLK
jgi:hypothetical protein